MPNPICATCRHWNDGTTWRRAELVKNEDIATCDELPRLLFVLVSSDTGRYQSADDLDIETPWDFGCTRWAALDDEDA